ncbi:MAG: HK97-gp10 family putative phage morphogenesis protein [Mycobacteriales bacterium]
MDGLRFIIDAAEVDDLLDGPEVEDLLQEVGDMVADRASEHAPKDSGEGAASIHAEVHRGDDATAFPSTFTPEDDVPTAYIGWDEDHFYMGFAETGTEHQPARPFLRPALDQTNI